MRTAGGRLGHSLNPSARDGTVQQFLNLRKIHKKCISFLSALLPSLLLLPIFEFKPFRYFSEEEKHLSPTFSFTEI